MKFEKKMKGPFQLTNANGQPTLLPMIATTAANGFHPHQQAASALHNPHHVHAQGMLMPQAYIDSNGLIHPVSAAAGPAPPGQATTISPGAAAATANGLLAPQQRTDRLTVRVFHLVAFISFF